MQTKEEKADELLEQYIEIMKDDSIEGEALDIVVTKLWNLGYIVRQNRLLNRITRLPVIRQEAKGTEDERM